MCFLVAHLLAFPMALTAAVEPRGVHNVVSEEGLDEIIARLEWYDTSIQSFRIRYRIIIEPHPEGRRQFNRAAGRNDPIAEHWVNQHEGFEEEFVQSDDKVWVKRIDLNPSPGREDQAIFVWVSDGKEMRSLAYRLDGTPTHGGAGEDFAKGRVPLASPTLVAGMRFSSRKRALYQDLKQGKLKLKGTVMVNGRLLHRFSDAASANQADRTELDLDPQHMFLPRQRVHWAGGKLGIRTTVEEFARFADASTKKEERWFPTEVTKEEFFEGQLETTTKVTTTSLEINPSIPDSVFELTMPGGILVSDSKTRETRFHGTEEQRREFALKTAAKAKADLDAELAKASSNQRTLSPPSRFPWVPLGIGVVGVAMVFLGVAIRRSFSK